MTGLAKVIETVAMATALKPVGSSSFRPSLEGSEPKSTSLSPSSRPVSLHCGGRSNLSKQPQARSPRSETAYSSLRTSLPPCPSSPHTLQEAVCEAHLNVTHELRQVEVPLLPEVGQLEDEAHGVICLLQAG